MNDSEIAESLAKAIMSDRGVGKGIAGGLAADYLAWRSKLEKREVAEWEDRKAKRYVERTWLSEGRPSVVFAGQGKGKSNFAAWVIEKVLETRPGWDIYTNIPFPWEEEGGGPPEARPCDRLHAVGSLSEVLRGAAESVKAGRKPAVVIDEMDQAVTSHNWQSEGAQSWQLLLNIERHLKIRGPLLVYHAYRHIPIVLREGTMLKSLLQVIIKDRDHWAICREEDGFLRVPPTVLPYLAYGLRGFDIDVDVQDLERHLSGSIEAVVGQVLTYLDLQQKGNEAASVALRERSAQAEQEKADRAEVKTLVFQMLDESGGKKTVREIADETHLSKSNVGRLRVAWVAERSRSSRASRA